MDTNDFMNVLKKLKLLEDEIDGNEMKEEVAETAPDLVDLKEDTKQPLEGFIAFYVNVGQMPGCNVERYMRRTMDSYKKVLKRMPEKYAALWIPCRHSETRIEVIRL